MSIALGTAMDAAAEIDVDLLRALCDYSTDATGAPALTTAEEHELRKALALLDRLRGRHNNHPQNRGWLLPHEKNLATVHPIRPKTEGNDVA